MEQVKNALAELPKGAYVKVKTDLSVMPQGISKFVRCSNNIGIFSIGGRTFAASIEAILSLERVDPSTVDPTMELFFESYVQKWIAAH